MPPPQRFHAIIDSNVMLEIASCVDLNRAYEDGLEPASPEAVLRRQKARESLLLSMHLNNVSATTFSLFEATRIMTREVDPRATDTFENQALIVWAHYVKDTILPNWLSISPSSGDQEPTGSQADALLVRLAVEHRVPLISHEGIRVSGVEAKRGIRKKARDAGATILTPKEFYGDMDELLESARFMQTYEKEARPWAETSKGHGVLRETMEWLHAYYRHVLYGITKGYSEPLRVRL